MRLAEKAPRQPDAAGDALALEGLKTVAQERATYGYRRACALLNRQRRVEGLAPVNRKRAYRLMRDAGLLLQRHTGKPTCTHEGTIITLKSDLRWCSDGSEIRC